jgi:hypothetical protein
MGGLSVARCIKYQEDECIGHDCLDRVGSPCIFDSLGRAGTEDMEPEETSCSECDGINGNHIHGCPNIPETWESLTDEQKNEELNIVRGVYGHLSDPL